MGRFDEAKFALEAATGGKNTLLLDDIGMPSVMVRIPSFKWCDVIEDGDDALCSAFIVDGKEKDCIYISKYQNIIEYDRAYSLPARAAENYSTFEECKAACDKKGPGWHLMSNAEWMAIAHWCYKNGTVPSGNNNFGNDINNPHIRGVDARSDYKVKPNSMECILTGTGPNSWSHDGTSAGIFDLTGNLWDFISGLRQVNGEIQIIKDNDSAMGVDESDDSPLWRAIDVHGHLVPPGSPNTYKFDSLKYGSIVEKPEIFPSTPKLCTERKNPEYLGPIEDADEFGYTIARFPEMQIEEGLQPHLLLKKLGLYPTEPCFDRCDSFFLRTYGLPRYALRGGSWYDKTHAGPGDLFLAASRYKVFPDLGFRAAYVDL